MTRIRRTGPSRSNVGYGNNIPITNSATGFNAKNEMATMKLRERHEGRGVRGADKPHVKGNDFLEEIMVGNEALAFAYGSDVDLYKDVFGVDESASLEDIRESYMEVLACMELALEASSSHSDSHARHECKNERDDDSFLTEAATLLGMTASHRAVGIHPRNYIEIKIDAVKRAYQVLIDPESRLQYDEYLIESRRIDYYLKKENTKKNRNTDKHGSRAAAINSRSKKNNYNPKQKRVRFPDQLVQQLPPSPSWTKKSSAHVPAQDNNHDSSWPFDGQYQSQALYQTQTEPRPVSPEELSTHSSPEFFSRDDFAMAPNGAEDTSDPWGFPPSLTSSQAPRPAIKKRLKYEANRNFEEVPALNTDINLPTYPPSPPSSTQHHHPIIEPMAKKPLIGSNKSSFHSVQNENSLDPPPPVKEVRAKKSKNRKGAKSFRTEPLSPIPTWRKDLGGQYYNIIEDDRCHHSDMFAEEKQDEGAASERIYTPDTALHHEVKCSDFNGVVENEDKDDSHSMPMARAVSPNSLENESDNDHFRDLHCCENDNSIFSQESKGQEEQMTECRYDFTGGVTPRTEHEIDHGENKEEDDMMDLSVFGSRKGNSKRNPHEKYLYDSDSEFTEFSTIRNRSRLESDESSHGFESALDGLDDDDDMVFGPEIAQKNTMNDDDDDSVDITVPTWDCINFIMHYRVRPSLNAFADEMSGTFDDTTSALGQVWHAFHISEDDVDATSTQIHDGVKRSL